jgi:hypothetical protein
MLRLAKSEFEKFFSQRYPFEPRLPNHTFPDAEVAVQRTAPRDFLVGFGQTKLHCFIYHGLLPSHSSS